MEIEFTPDKNINLIKESIKKINFDEDPYMVFIWNGKTGKHLLLSSDEHMEFYEKGLEIFLGYIKNISEKNAK